MKVHLALLFSVALFGQPASERQKLMGTWQLDKETWIIEQKPALIHFTHSKNDQKVREFECNTMGKECTSDGVKVSMWFSGTKLVQIETKGSDVVKRQFGVAADGDTLELETTSIVPDGKPETVKFKRQPVTTTSAQK